MPLSELQRLAKGKHKSAQQLQQLQTASASHVHVHSSSQNGSDLVELVCENGEVMIKEHLNRVTKQLHESNNNTSNDADLHHQSSRTKHKYSTNDVSGVTAAESSIHRTFEPSGDHVLHLKDSQSHRVSDQKYTSFAQCDLSSLRPNVSQSDRVSLPSVHSIRKMQTQDQEQRVSSSNVINFPHFAAIVKPSLHGISSKSNPEVHVTKKDNGKAKVFAPLSKELASSSQVNVAMSKSPELPDQVVVESSMCSANNVDRASNDTTYSTKRSYNESEDSEYPSEEVKEESVDIKKASSGWKRSRAAEVHNLSERRRRDKINEKMRALQELIPNCNKVDKASMLDEAIEYLKTLQLQVQMMSMGHGVCMSPMTLPYAAHMPRFSPMGIGMGYGLNMVDMNMNSSSLLFPMATASQFGTLNARPMPNIPMFGFQGQGVAMPESQAPIRTTVEPVHNAATDISIAKQVENDDHHPSTSKATEASFKS